MASHRKKWIDNLLFLLIHFELVLNYVQVHLIEPRIDKNQLAKTIENRITCRSALIVNALAMISFFLATPASCKARWAARSARIFWPNSLNNNNFQKNVSLHFDNTYKHVLLQATVVSYSSDPSQQSKWSKYSFIKIIFNVEDWNIPQIPSPTKCEGINEPL